MTIKDNFLKGAGGGKNTDLAEEFFRDDKDLDEVDGAVFEEITDDDEDLLLGSED